MSNKRDYYEVLGIDKKATKDEIKKAFRKLSMQYHPDRQQGKSDKEKKEAEEKFKEIAEAYDTLSNDQKRESYDNFGFGGQNSGGFQGFDMNDFMSHHADFFDGFPGFDFNFGGFGRRNRGQQEDPNGPKDGPDIRTEITISFEEALFGCNKDLEINVPDPCDHCHGTKSEDGKVKTCTTCGGKGMVTRQSGFMVQMSTCPDCRGQGTIIENVCTHCHGSGIKEAKRSINVTIPHGISDGSNLRISGAGPKGRNGGKNGDIYACLLIKESDLFRRDGLNLGVEAHIDIQTASLGGTISVPTPYGMAELNIKPGVESGSSLRLNGKGVKDPNGTVGNLYVHILVDTPQNLNDNQKDLIKKLKDSLTKDNYPKISEFNKNTNEFIKRNSGKIKEMNS